MKFNKTKKNLYIQYFLSWSIVYKKGYQQFDTVSSTVTTKVKGLGFINDTNRLRQNNIFDKHLLYNGPDQFRLFDVSLDENGF